jgi:DNA-binding beta-propeller fold protein YncE
LNSGDGTVTIFAVESDDHKIGNNDHLLSTVKVGSNPMRIAPTPDGRYAYVSSPADNSVWKIDVSDPTNPKAKQIPIPSLGKPGGIAITNSEPFLVWIADSVKCVMHVLDASSDTEAIAPIALAWISTGSHSSKFLGDYDSFFPTPCR